VIRPRNSDGLPAALQVPGQADERERRLRAALAHYGALLFVSDVELQAVPALELTLAEGLRLSHSDPAVAGTLPVVLWRNRHVDLDELVRLALRQGEGQALGFFFELTDQLASAGVFTAAAQPLREKRLKRMRNFFSPNGRFRPYERELAVRNTPEVAKRWHFLMNMSLESFASHFRKGTQPRVDLEVRADVRRRTRG